MQPRHYFPVYIRILAYVKKKKEWSTSRNRCRGCDTCPSNPQRAVCIKQAASPCCHLVGKSTLYETLSHLVGGVHVCACQDDMRRRWTVNPRLRAKTERQRCFTAPPPTKRRNGAPVHFFVEDFISRGTPRAESGISIFRFIITPRNCVQCSKSLHVISVACLLHATRDTNLRVSAGVTGRSLFLFVHYCLGGKISRPPSSRIVSI